MHGGSHSTDMELSALYGRNLTDDLNLQDRFVVGTGANMRTAKRYGEPRLFGVAAEVQF